MEMNRNALPDDALEAVSGGVNVKSLPRTKAWDLACSDYECGICGMRGKNRSDHKSGCAVLGIGHPDDGIGIGNVMYEEFNCCWSCKHHVYGNNYPSDPGDMYCGKG